MSFSAEKKRRPIFWIFAVIVLILLCELIAGVGLWLLPMSSTHEPRYLKMLQSTFAKQIELDMRPHPFFGFIPKGKYEELHAQSWLREIKRKDSKIFAIGIFGGSVASSLYNYLKEKNFSKELQRKIPKLRDKNLVFFNFAIGCGKQPQQLAIYMQNAENLDLSINLDGFNEQFFNFSVKASEEPCFYNTLFLYSDRGIAAKISHRILRSFTKSYLNFGLKFELFSHSSLYVLGWKLLHKGYIYYQRPRGRELEKLTEAQKIAWNEALGISGARLWGRYTRMQAILAKGLQKPAIFLLQPAPQIPNSKKFSDEELAQQGSVFQRELDIARMQAGYKQAQIELAEMRQKNVLVSDLTHIFKTEESTVYIDACCHLNSKGYQLMEPQLIQLITKAVYAKNRAK